MTQKLKKYFTDFECTVVHIDGSKSKFISSMEGWDTNQVKKLAKNNNWAIPVKYVTRITYKGTRIV